MLLCAATVLPGPAGEALSDAAVLVNGDTVIAVGSREVVEQQAPPGTPVRNFPSGTVLPGLINAHVHLVFDGGPQPAQRLQAENDDVRLVLAMASRAETLLRSGVTTARDLGDRGGLSMRVRDAIAAGELAGPRVLAAMMPLTPPGGHCWFLGGEVAGESEIREQVRRHATVGADAIKIMASGGAATQGNYAMWDCQFTTAELRAAVEEAHEHGLRVAAHAHAADSIARAVDAGVDSIEHGSWLTPGRGLEPRDEVADQMAAQGTVLCHASSNDWRVLAPVRGEEWSKEVNARVAWYEDHGVTLIAGTDAGINGFTSSPAALARFGEYGFSAERAIEIGTVDGAQALGLGAMTGALRPGLAADILVVEGNPLQDLHALEQVRGVLARGTWYEPAR